MLFLIIIAIGLLNFSITRRISTAGSGSGKENR
jgi:hypothetical protein